MRSLPGSETLLFFEGDRSTVGEICAEHGLLLETEFIFPYITCAVIGAFKLNSYECEFELGVYGGMCNTVSGKRVGIHLLVCGERQRTQYK